MESKDFYNVISRYDHIKYVHQLQNWYYTVRNEELIWNR